MTEPTNAPPIAPARRSRRRRAARLLVELAIIGAIFFGIRAWQTRSAISGPAPELMGQALDGSSLSLADARGEPVLVHFWATWCGVCQLEEGNVQAIARNHRTITVAASSGDAGNVRDYLQRRGLDFPVLVDEEGDLASRWGVRAFPTSFVIDPDGEIRFVEVGYTTRPGLALRLWLARLLG